MPSASAWRMRYIVVMCSPSRLLVDRPAAVVYNTYIIKAHCAPVLSHLLFYNIQTSKASGAEVNVKVIHLISGGDTGGAKTHVHSLLHALSKKPK